MHLVTLPLDLHKIPSLGVGIKVPKVHTKSIIFLAYFVNVASSIIVDYLKVSGNNGTLEI